MPAVVWLGLALSGAMPGSFSVTSAVSGSMLPSSGTSKARFQRKVGKRLSPLSSSSKASVSECSRA